MNTETLKQAGNEMMRALVRDGAKCDTRGNVRFAIVSRLQVRDDLSSNAKRFIGDYLMAQFGYGGGL